MRCLRARISAAVMVLTMLSAESGSAAPIPLCVRVDAAGKEVEGLRKLVQAELGHHRRTHQPVASGCEATLEVGLFVVDGVRHLTVRLGDQVPVRHTYGDRSELTRKLSEAVAIVLHHDPEYLRRDISRYSATQRALHSILRRGHNRFALELFQVVARSGEGAVTVPAGALAFHRGSEHWQVFSRVYFGGSLSGVVEGRRLGVFSGADVGLTYELSARADTSFYVSVGAGIQLLGFEGRLQVDDPDSLETVIKVGGTLSGRVGVRMFRASDFDLDIFGAGYVPMFTTRDPDSSLMDVFTPSVLVGVGVGF